MNYVETTQYLKSLPNLCFHPSANLIYRNLISQELYLFNKIKK